MNAPLRVLVIKDHDKYVAQALEVDVCAQGDSEAEAAMMLQAAITAESDEAQKQSKSLVEAIGPAPRRFHEMYEFTHHSHT